MRTFFAGCAVAAIATGAVSAANPRVPPGGPAPKSMLGTWTTKLTAADAKRAPVQRQMPSGSPTWYLIILNSGVGASPRVLGLRPGDESGPSIPFGVAGNMIHLECLSNANGLPLRGHDTFRWSIRAGALRFKAVHLVCKAADDRNRAIVLTSEPWRHGR
jgi:hypothetical protein